ncbi:hypothetical protein GUF79_19230, partial [Xanthomonas citri pv. citri]|nr:hypothetical protein [Xanthomonas citri pv. citri]
KIAKMAQADIKKLISISEQKISVKLPELIEKASQEADSILSAELHRLTSLQAVNKNIRADEIEALEQQRVDSLNQIALANWRLDSLRVIVSNK